MMQPLNLALDKTLGQRKGEGMGRIDRGEMMEDRAVFTDKIFSGCDSKLVWDCLLSADVGRIVGNSVK